MIGMSLNCRDQIHAPACSGGTCNCACHAVPRPSYVKELAAAISARGRAQMAAERAERDADQAAARRVA